jgi:AP-1 complex subunit gamma-1
MGICYLIPDEWVGVLFTMNPAFLQAALCACRIIHKVPDLLENFVPLVRQLLNERNHGVLLTGVTLAMDMCQMDTETLDYFRRVREWPIEYSMLEAAR